MSKITGFATIVVGPIGVPEKASVSVCCINIRGCFTSSLCSIVIPNTGYLQGCLHNIHKMLCDIISQDAQSAQSGS